LNIEIEKVERVMVIECVVIKDRVPKREIEIELNYLFGKFETVT
jgi:hypothetical protein